MNGQRRSSKFRLGALVAFGVGVLASAAWAAVPGDVSCPNEVGRDFPSAAVTSRGLSPEPLLELFRRLDDQQLDIRGLLVLKDCTLVVERYKEGVGRDHNHALYSVTKSVVSTLVGALQQEGKLADLDRPFTGMMARPAAIPQRDWERASTISLRNVLNMASGYAHVNHPSVHPLYDTRNSTFALALAQQLITRPGSVFNYSNADASIAGAVVAAVAGKDMYGYARTALLEPLGMVNHAWLLRDAAGRYPGGWGFRMRPMDMLKLGQLYLQKGRWNGKRIFDENFAAEAWTSGVANGYGLYWWGGTRIAGKAMEYHEARGFKGQRIYVFPTLGVVVAVVASLTSDEERTMVASVLSAIVDAASPASSKPGVQAREVELESMVRAGFRGVTRVRQSSQDIPGKP